MTSKLTLRLREADVRALEAAAVKIAGPTGGPFVGRTAVIRTALEAFNAKLDQGQQEAQR